MDEEEAKKLKEELEKVKKELEDKEKAIAEKDQIIAQKNQDLVGQRKQYKKLADMSQEEKDELSQKELELQERQEAFEERQEAFEKAQKEQLQKEIDARRDNQIKKMVGDNDEFAEKLKENFNLIKGSEEASTEQEIEEYMNKAFNMLGDEKPDPVSESFSIDGRPAGDTQKQGFAETPEGKALESNLFPEGEPIYDETNPAPEGDQNPDLNS